MHGFVKKKFLTLFFHQVTQVHFFFFFVANWLSHGTTEGTASLKRS